MWFVGAVSWVGSFGGSITWILGLKNWLAFDMHGRLTSVLPSQYFAKLRQASQEFETSLDHISRVSHKKTKRILWLLVF